MDYLNKYKLEVLKRLKPLNDVPILTMEDLHPLPEPVQKYLIYVGSIGKPQIQNFRAVFNGSMKRNKKSNWMAINSQQYNFFDEPSRFFYIRAKIFGIPFDGLHVYTGNEATMLIKVASMFQVVDAKGEKMSHGETVTMLNDMCFMAPATLISEDIKWETIDSHSVKAIYTNDTITVSAILKFNQMGELIDFISEDRYYCEDGINYLSYKWSTPISNYEEMDGRKIPTYGEAIWHIPYEGEFCNAKFDLKAIEYNCSEFKY